MYLQNLLSTIWYILPGAYSLLGSLSFLPSGIKVSRRQTRKSKQGKLSKSLRPELRNVTTTYSIKSNKLEISLPEFKERYRNMRNTDQKIDLKMSSKGVVVLGKKSSW